MIQKIWKFILFILPWTRSTIKDAKEILGYVDEGLAILEIQGTKVTHVRNVIDDLKKGL